MLDYLRLRWSQGTRTSGFPTEPVEFPDRFRGRPTLDAARCGDACAGCAERCPTAGIAHDATGRSTLDLAGCLFAPEEAASCPAGAIQFTQDPRLAARRRADLLGSGREAPAVAKLEGRMRALFGRSLRLRSVAAGSCNGCESELVALGNVVFDMGRFGVQFVASPRHADGLVVSGAVSRNMRDALYRTYEAMPEPRLVIAVGACACSGGPFRGSPEVLDGIPADLPVDLWIPGCPPHPITVLDGLLRLLGQLGGES